MQSLQNREEVAEEETMHGRAHNWSLRVALAYPTEQDRNACAEGAIL